MADTLKKGIVPAEEVAPVQALEMEALLTVLERRGVIQRAEVLEEVKRLKKRTGKRVSLRGLAAPETKESGRDKAPAKGMPPAKTNTPPPDRPAARGLAVAETKESPRDKAPVGKPPVDWMAVAETDQGSPDKASAPAEAAAEPKESPQIGATKGKGVADASVFRAGTGAAISTPPIPVRREESRAAHEQVTFEAGKEPWPSGHQDSLYELACLQCPAWRMTVRGQRAAQDQVEEHSGMFGHRIRVTCTSPSRSEER